MKILSLGLDNSALNRNSALAKRLVEYGQLTEKYLVIVPSRQSEEIQLSEKVTVYGSGGGNKLWQIIKIYYSANKLLRSERCDLITVQDQYYLALVGLVLSKRFKIGLEIQVHGFEKFYGIRKLIAKLVLLKANSVRCVSLNLKEQLTDQFGVDEKIITVVPIYSERSINSEQSQRREDGKFVFISVGRLVPVKNVGLQIEAMAEVAKKFPNAELWIIGEGPERRNLESEIKNQELGKCVILKGWQNDVEYFYRRADAYLLTSNSEGWGLAVIDAAWHKLPIIMTDVGLAREVVKNGESGLVIPVGNKQILIEAMLKIIQDKNLRLRLSENAKLAVYNLLSKEQTQALYKESWERAKNNL